MTLALYLSVWTRGGLVGWSIGFAHGMLAILALAGLNAAHDAHFAIGMATIAVYGGAMATTEFVRRLGGVPRSKAV